MTNVLEYRSFDNSIPGEWDGYSNWIVHAIFSILLFIIFVNCLPDAVNCKTIMYADDTTWLFKATFADELSTVMTSNLPPFSCNLA